MPILNAENKRELERRLEKDLENEITVKLFTQPATQILVPGRECPTCGDTQELLQEVSALSPKLHLEVIDFFSRQEERQKHNVERIPAILLGKDGVYNIRYYGIPAGYEFVTLLEGFKLVSRGVSPLKPETRKKLRLINKPVHIQVFVTPT